MYFEGKGQLKEANEVYSRFQNEFPDHELLEKRKVLVCCTSRSLDFMASPCCIFEGRLMFGKGRCLMHDLEQCLTACCLLATAGRPSL